jgi:dipeptidase E
MKKLLLASSFEKFADKLDTIPHPALSSLNVVCIPTAAYGEEKWDWLPRDMAPVQKRAKTFREFNIAGQSLADVRQALQGADVIYVTGGNTYYLLEQAQKCDFKGALKEAMNTGATYFGTCAGAILVCPRIDFIADMDNVAKATLTEFNGLGLVDFLVMPHTDNEGYGPVVKRLTAELKAKHETVIGLRDDQALYIHGNYIEVF